MIPAGFMMLTKGSLKITPALLTRISIRPCCATTDASTALASSGCVTSKTRYARYSGRLFKASTSRSATITMAPRSCKCVAMASPSPLTPPVTRAIAPLICKIHSLFLQHVHDVHDGNHPFDVRNGEGDTVFVFQGYHQIHLFQGIPTAYLRFCQFGANL